MANSSVVLYRRPPDRGRRRRSATTAGSASSRSAVAPGARRPGRRRGGRRPGPGGRRGGRNWTADPVNPVRRDQLVRPAAPSRGGRDVARPIRVGDVGGRARVAARCAHRSRRSARVAAGSLAGRVARVAARAAAGESNPRRSSSAVIWAPPLREHGQRCAGSTPARSAAPLRTGPHSTPSARSVGGAATPGTGSRAVLAHP